MNSKVERKSQNARVDITCGTCFDVVMRFYLVEDRLTVDTRHPATRLYMDDGAPNTMDIERQWFRGMDVAQELSDCSDAPQELQCKCGTRTESLVMTAELARQTWPTERRAVRLTI